MIRTVITGTGSYIPEIVKSNRDFAAHDFYLEDETKIQIPPTKVTEKFQQITGIEERRYAVEGLTASDIATKAAKLAIEDAGIDKESIDQIIVAHNFGNVVKHTIQTDVLPSLASRVKHDLGIANPSCIPYDVLFGCPGWVQGVIQSDAYFKADIARCTLVIGTETLSRVLDKYDRDSMIFSDGAGATILQAETAYNGSKGVLATSTLSHTLEEAYYPYMGKSNFPDSDPRVRYIKMKGRKIYEYALKNVPQAMKGCLDKSPVTIRDVKKIFIHQANEKLDTGVVKAFYKLYGIDEVPENVMPMSIHKLGNSSVATVPTLYDMVRKGKVEGFKVEEGDVIIFASVGAGMNINAVCYRV